MTKEEIINKFIERRKEGIPDIFVGYCSSTRCDSCYLKNKGEQFCYERMFEILLDHIMELEESQKAETNLEHYFKVGDVIVYHGQQIIHLNDNCWDTYDKSKTSHIVRWLLLPYEKPKPKFKLTKFEYDLLSSYCELSDSITETWTLNMMQDKGYFKDIPQDVPIRNILDNCEVIES